MPSDDSEGLPHILLKRLKGNVGGGLSGHTHELKPGREPVGGRSIGLTQAPLRPVAAHHTADLTAHGEPNLPRPIPPPLSQTV